MVIEYKFEANKNDFYLCFDREAVLNKKPVSLWLGERDTRKVNSDFGKVNSDFGKVSGDFGKVSDDFGMHSKVHSTANRGSQSVVFSSSQKMAL